MPRRTLRAIDLGVLELSDRGRKGISRSDQGVNLRYLKISFQSDHQTICQEYLALGCACLLHLAERELRSIRSSGPQSQAGKLQISRKPCRLQGRNMHLYTASGLAS